MYLAGSFRAACVAGLALAAAPVPASAQDRDPFEAVLDAQAVRERQARQFSRAERRALDPFPGPDAAPPLPSGDPGRPVPIELPPDREPGEGSKPWLLPAVAAAAGALIFAIRRSRRRRWSALPGHQGLRRS